MAFGIAYGSSFTNRYGTWSKEGLELMFWDNYLGSYPQSGSLIKDLSGKGNDGTLNNFSVPPTSSSGFYNGAINYDGNNDYIIFPNSWLTSLTEFSFYIVFKIISPPNSHGIYDNGLLGPYSGGGTYIITTRLYGFGTFYAPVIYFDGNLANFYCSTNVGNVSPFIISDLTKYYHLAVTFKPNLCKVYANGELCHSQAIDIGFLSNIPASIGKYGSVQFWKGQIPVFIGYNKCLEEEQINQNYNYFKRFYN